MDIFNADNGLPSLDWYNTKNDKRKKRSALRLKSNASTILKKRSQKC